MPQRCIVTLFRIYRKATEERSDDPSCSGGQTKTRGRHSTRSALWARSCIRVAERIGRRERSSIASHDGHSSRYATLYRRPSRANSNLTYSAVCSIGQCVATQLTAVLNDSLRISEEEAIAAVSADPTPVSSPSSPRTTRRINRMPGAPTTKLLAITSALNKDLTQLLVRLDYSFPLKEIWIVTHLYRSRGSSRVETKSAIICAASYKRLATSWPNSWFNNRFCKPTLRPPLVRSAMCPYRTVRRR